MSDHRASELLKKWTVLWESDVLGEDEVMDLLPLITDVVEAAEHTIGAGRFQAPPGTLPVALHALWNYLQGVDSSK